MHAVWVNPVSAHRAEDIILRLIRTFKSEGCNNLNPFRTIPALVTGMTPPCYCITEGVYMKPRCHFTGVWYSTVAALEPKAEVTTNIGQSVYKGSNKATIYGFHEFHLWLGCVRFLKG